MSGPVRKDDPTLPPPWQALQGAPRAAARLRNRVLIAPVGLQLSQQTATRITGTRART